MTKEEIKKTIQDIETTNGVIDRYKESHPEAVGIIEKLKSEKMKKWSYYRERNPSEELPSEYYVSQSPILKVQELTSVLKDSMEQVNDVKQMADIVSDYKVAVEHYNKWLDETFSFKGRLKTLWRMITLKEKDL